MNHILLQMALGRCHRFLILEVQYQTNRPPEVCRAPLQDYRSAKPDLTFQISHSVQPPHNCEKVEGVESVAHSVG